MSEPVQLPVTAALLSAGGDERIAVAVDTGVNAYGCRPYPDASLLDFGSSTASVISADGFECAERLRIRLADALVSVPAAVVYRQEMAQVREQLLRLCALRDDTGVIFSPSGTDVHAIAGLYAGSGAPQPARIVMIETNETGRGVAAALEGRRWANRAAASAAELVQIAVRTPDGQPRAMTAIDADVDRAVSDAIGQHRRVLLVVIDQSKTGLIAPSLATVLALRQRFSTRLDILVDACQFRIAPATLRAYLDLDFMVAITGSKFLAGPSFSAALLMSPSQAHCLAARPFPSALASAALQADWPVAWPGVERLPDAANFGLLLRWTVALHELREFAALPDAFILRFIDDFAGAIRQRLADDADFEPLPTPALDRLALPSVNAWDAKPTIFPFLICHNDAARTWLNAAETRKIYQQLPVELFGVSLADTALAAMRCRFGQPVGCGRRDGVDISALRICLSARLIARAAAEGDNGAAVIAAALRALDKAALLARMLTAPCRSDHERNGCVAR